MKYYQIYCPSWYPYQNEFSSLDKIKETLPIDKDFINNIVLSRLKDYKPGFHFNSEHLKNIKLQIHIEDCNIFVSLLGAVLIKNIYKTIPEIKEEGKPYSPPKTTRIGIEEYELTENDKIQVGYVEIIDLDKPKRIVT